MLPFHVSLVAATPTLGLVAFNLEGLAMYGLVALVIGLIAWSKYSEPPLSPPYPVDAAPEEPSAARLPGGTADPAVSEVRVPAAGEPQ